jgi:ATP-dependent Lon protease
VFDFRTTADLEDQPIRIIGQPRATEALALGLSVRSDGYNVFASGEVGTGRSTSVRRQLENVRDEEFVPEDTTYVHNFRDPDRPVLLRFPSGRARGFSRAMDETVAGLEKALIELFESDPFRKRFTRRLEEAQARQKDLFKDFEREVKEEGFALVQMQIGDTVRPEVLPILEEEPVDMDSVEALVEEGKFPRERFDRMTRKRGEFYERIRVLQKEYREQGRKLKDDLDGLRRSFARPVVEEAFADVTERFGDDDGVRRWLEAVQEDVLDRMDRIVMGAAEEPGPEKEKGADEVPPQLVEYKVNVVVNNRGASGRPVLWETSPSYRNLFGTIEKTRREGGEWSTDHTRIKAGSILQAHGGFLMLDAIDVLAEPGVWPALKRTLRNRVLEIQSWDPTQVLSGIAMKPEPAPIDVKVVLIGTPHIYRLLYNLDEDFKKIFKVKAEFALETERSAEELQNYARFVNKKTRDDSLPPFHRDAVAAVVEEGVRLAGRRDRLTTRFYEVADITREAGYWARKTRAKTVRAAHVDLAVGKRYRRHDLLEELLQRRIADGTILLNTTGETVGQVNGLVVLDVGDHVFGQPARITSITAVGGAGIIDIERESEKSGALHTKGVLILAGFLRSRFAQSKPLALSASLCFEQNYGPIDGDSASSAELYALLSSLSGAPVRQGIAVTGSVNQYGEIQPIGGVNEKVQGYFDLCRLCGITGEQGVLIPKANVPHLMLRKDLIQAVRKREFRIWAVATVEEGIEVLTGLKAGARGSDGAYTSGTVFRRADDRLAELAEMAREFKVTDRQ